MIFKILFEKSIPPYCRYTSADFSGEDPESEIFPLSPTNGTGVVGKDDKTVQFRQNCFGTLDGVDQKGFFSINEIPEAKAVSR